MLDLARVRGASCFFLLALLLLARPAHASSVTIGASEDSSIAGGQNAVGPVDYRTFNNGGFDSLFTGRNAYGPVRSLIKFAVPASLQNKVVVQRVQISFWNFDLPNPANRVNGNLSLQRVSQNWSAGTTNAGATTARSVGAACVSGVTWFKPNCAGGPWWTAGAPVTGNAYAGPNTGNPASPSPINSAALTFDSGTCTGTPNTRCADLQSWIDTPSGNYGYLLTSDSSATPSLQRFHSMDSASVANRPSMTIYYTTCTAAANSACKVGFGTNACNDNGGNNGPTTYTCTCGTGFSGTGTTACTDINGCNNNPCNDNGDNGSTCFDVAGPGTGNTCSCTSGYQDVSGVCTNMDGCLNNPCDNSGDTGAVCTDSPPPASGTAHTCTCTTGYTSSGGVCVNQNACVGGALTSCKTTITGNTCNDLNPPSTSYTCTCGATGYSGTGTTSCVDFNACVGNPCDDGGDAGATCNDLAAPSLGYTCSCSGGYSSNGTTCVSNCNMPTSNPCGAGGTCSVVSGGWTCACGTGYVSSGGSQPTCVNYDACTAGGGNTSCKTAQGNTCNDAAPPSASYTCTCGAAYTGTGTTACNDKNECAPNPCDDGGDIGSAMKCTDVAAPGTGYSCTCDVGFTFTGGTCTSACSGMSNPCGVGGSCSIVGTGGWSCACDAGYVSSGGTQPTCNEINACDATAIANCTTFASNSCVDEAPPSATYHCTCGNAAFVVGTGSNGKPACVDKDECVGNPCDNGGDSGAECADNPAPSVGYDCTCSSEFWQKSSSGPLTCVDVDECAAASNPCLAGVCTNQPNGSGYTCKCNAGYVVTAEDTPTPFCVHPSSCGGDSEIACVSSQDGNRCVDQLPPKIDYNCVCDNPAYVLSSDKRSCLDRNECIINRCINGGDRRARCIDHRAPKAGYECGCSEGWRFDGSTCVDVDECSGGGNPCGRGTCNNVEGSYQCACPSGYEVSKGARPTCELNANGYISYTVEPGSCSALGALDPLATGSNLLLLLGALAACRRRRRR